MTTVGYGDVVPRTICGKLFGSVCAMMGKCDNDFQYQEDFIRSFWIQYFCTLSKEYFAWLFRSHFSSLTLITFTTSTGSIVN